MRPYLLIWSDSSYCQYVEEYDLAADRDAAYQGIKASAIYAACADVVVQTTGARESALTAVDQ